MDGTTNNTIGTQKVTLRKLDPNLYNAFIVGIIIGKQRPRKFVDSKSAELSYKAVWNFTFRDSRPDYINVTYWGSSELIYEISDKFHVGDVVEIYYPKISIRQLNDYGEQFRPMVTSPYSLTLNERSEIVKHNGEVELYLPLLHLPTKPMAGFVPLRDIHNNGATMKDITVDILGVVKGVRDSRNVTTKNGEMLPVREFEVFDHTSPGVKVTTWDPEIITSSNNWKSRETILFMTDLKIEWSNFARSFTATTTNRTIVTENPRGAEVAPLVEYAKTAPIQTFDFVGQLTTAFPDPSIIQDVMSVKQIQDRLNSLVQGNQTVNKQFTALVYAIVSNFDLDGLSRTLLIRCGYCKSRIETGTVCENVDCCETGLDPEISFDIRVTLSDHTGSLINCRLTGPAAELAVGCNAKVFSQMPDEEKCILKWRFLMERCAVRMAFLIMNNSMPIISIVSIGLANKFEAAQRIPVY